MDPLVNVDWLEENLKDPNLIILDASPETNVSGLIAEYLGIQIKDARHFDLKNVFCDKESEIPNMIPNSEVFTEECQKLGIKNNSKIVVYDNLGIYTSPRVWWMFKVMGHENIAVLNGGLSAWKNKNLPCESTNNLYTNYQKGDFTAFYNADLVKDAQFLLHNIETKECLVIDARSKDRFYGETPEPRENMKSGHIPRSINLPFEHVLKNGCYLPREDLKTIYKSLNINNESLIFTCGSGITACIVLLALEFISSNKKAIYDGSWAE